MSDQSGFTLTELLVSVGLVGLVVIGAFRLYYFTDKAFVNNTVKSDIQIDMQLAMQRITEELRLAHSVEFVDKVPATDVLNEDDHYLFSKDGTVFLQTKQGTRLLTLHYQEAAQYSVSFAYGYDESGKMLEDTVRVTLESLTPGVSHTLESHIQALNLRDTKVSGPSPSTALHYTKTFTPQEIEEGRKLRRRCFFVGIVYDDNDPETRVLRGFRDKVLSRTHVGRRLIAMYYELSPWLIMTVEAIGLSRDALRTITQPVVYSIWLMLNNVSLWGTLVLVTLLAVTMILGRRKKHCL